MNPTPYRTRQSSSPAAGTIGIEFLEHIQINVPELEPARAFYRDIFGLEEISRPPSFDFAGAWFRMGNLVLHLVVRPPEPASARHFCLWVSDVHYAAKFLSQKHFDVAWDTKYKIAGVDRFFVHDPAGNRIEIQGHDPSFQAEFDRVRPAAE